MRDHIGGLDPYMPELTIQQKSHVMKQACDVVGSGSAGPGETGKNLLNAFSVR